ncbi:hypothetical protein PSR1_01257 [Anaeromyxobacter sp. PSR-1]|nr:hypothetical protein PSR1_01257 [Anaeromyxobacter sp. PSR-1]
MANPSNGCWVRKPAEAARSAGSRPPWTMANSACSGLVRAARLRRAHRCVRSMAARISGASAVDGRQTSRTIITSEPIAVCIAIDDSGVRSCGRPST